MNILLDGKFFAEWDGPLIELAEFSEIDVSRFSVDPNDLARKEREEFKATRAVQVAAIVVITASGNAFDGDELSQERMSRSITALDQGDTIPWVLHDNSVINATREELREALRLAGAAQAAFWVQK